MNENDWRLVQPPRIIASHRVKFEAATPFTGPANSAISPSCGRGDFNNRPVSLEVPWHVRHR